MQTMKRLVSLLLVLAALLPNLGTVALAVSDTEEAPVAVTEETIPISERELPEETAAAEETVPETLPEETVPEEALPEPEEGPTEQIPEETAEETVPTETVPETIPQETIPEETVMEEEAEEPPEETQTLPVEETEEAAEAPTEETVVLLEDETVCDAVANAEAVPAEDSDSTMNIYGIYLTREGDASLVESEGHWLLIDTGIQESQEELVETISAYGIEELDVLISHVHTDHIGGFQALMDSGVTINRLYLPHEDLAAYYQYNEHFLNLLSRQARSNNSEVEIIPLKKDSTFTFGDVSATVLGPVGDHKPSDFTATDSQTREEKYVNCRSLTVRFDCGSVSFLTGGDIEEQEEYALVAEYEGTGALDADIMKLSHHALPSSNREEFLSAVSPRYSYALNSNKTISEGSDYRMYYSSCKNASQYGPVYLVGDEKVDFRARVVNGRIDIFKGDQELKGLVTLAGGDGTVTKTYKYYITGGEVAEGVYTIDGEKYYISDGGFVNKAFYSHNLGRYVYRYEPVEGGDVRYVDEEGVLYTGFHEINDYYRYFDTETGVMAVGDEDYSPVAIGEEKYAINENGVVYNYAAKSGAWKKYDSNYRYFGSDGVMATGWLKVDGKKYYMDPDTGLRTIGLKEIDGKTYYFVEKNNAGYAWCDGWKSFDDNYRYFDSKGVMKTGWQTINGTEYYLDKDTGLRHTGFAKDGSKYYYVKGGKRSTKTGFVKVDGEYYQIKKGVRVTSAPYEKCGKVYLRLSTTSYTYNGKAKKPSVKVYTSSGSTVSSKYYTVKYASGRKNVGEYKVTVTFKGKYSGTEKLYFTIKPTPTEIDSISAGTGSLKVKIEKKTKQVTGYQLQYSTSKSFSSAEKETIKSDQTTSVKLSGLKSGKTYYVRVRTYTSVDGEKFYSSWSDYVSKKTK